jgi:aldehyde dehydrogenase (NAD+)
MTAPAREHAARPLHLNLIGGERRPATDWRVLPMVCPSDGLPFAAIPRSGPAEIDAAVAAARAAFEGDWGRLTATERGRLLCRLGEAVSARVEELGALESRDTGKPLSQGRADMVATARYFEFYGTAADKLHGETIPFLNGYTVAVVRDPHGVTGHIVPWNYPAQIFGRSVGASLACGNACVVKPAEDAGLSLLRMAELALRSASPRARRTWCAGWARSRGSAGRPSGNRLHLLNRQPGGRRARAGCGGAQPRRLHAGARRKIAPDRVRRRRPRRRRAVLVRAIVQNGGQTCSAGSRLLVEARAYDEVVAAITERFARITAGHHERDLDLGALISARQKRRVEGFAARAREAGVPTIAEGRIDGVAPAGGFYVAPILFGPVPRANDLAAEEVFGPVLSVIPFADEADAVRLANGTPYGLVASVWTRDAGRSLRVARAMRCGQVFVNAFGAGGGIELPFGGVKRSGHGREKGFEALYEFSASKTIVLSHG